MKATGTGQVESQTHRTSGMRKEVVNAMCPLNIHIYAHVYKFTVCIFTVTFYCCLYIGEINWNWQKWRSSCFYIAEVHNVYDWLVSSRSPFTILQRTAKNVVINCWQLFSTGKITLPFLTAVVTILEKGERGGGLQCKYIFVAFLLVLQFSTCENTHVLLLHIFSLAYLLDYTNWIAIAVPILLWLCNGIAKCVTHQPVFGTYLLAFCWFSKIFQKSFAHWYSKYQ